MLNQVTLAHSVLFGMGQKLTNDVKLVIPRKNLVSFFLAGLRILPLNDLGVVFEDVRQASSRQDSLPQKICFKPLRVGRISSSIVPTLVERQKPRTFALQMRTKAHFMVIDREVGHTTTKLKQDLARIAVTFVLLHRIFHSLFCEAVF